MTNETTIERDYQVAREVYAGLGVDTEAAVATLGRTPIALQCWQGDDVQGFEGAGPAGSTGGLQVTGGFPGRARTLEELRNDLEKAMSLIPGMHRVNLHAMYGDFGGKRVDRDAILPEHFQSWIAWAAAHTVKLDFNSTCFAHPKADSGFTLSHRDSAVRGFWIEHVRRCRIISSAIGRAQKDPCIHDLWIPDGSKDITVDRMEYRSLLKGALDTVLAESLDPREAKDALESKLFGIGSEAFVVGSHEFYLAYCVAHGVMPCVDMGHFHPTESIADKVSSFLLFVDELLLHVSRGIRWDSDHVVVLNDDVRALMEEIVRSGQLHRVHLALDYFDASINRVGAWVIGSRSAQKALLFALLEPTERLRAYEHEGDYFARLALLEELKTLPAGAVWDHFCLVDGVPPGRHWMDDIKRYEHDVQRARG